jgi:hypothetical protein
MVVNVDVPKRLFYEKPERKELFRKKKRFSSYDNQ